MAVEGNYLSMYLQISDLDQENRAYFAHCATHDYHLQACEACNLLRYPPTTACPWCSERKSRWVSVEGRGTVHSYEVVHHAVNPALRPFAPYMTLLVDLDTQNGVPTKHEALRVIGNLVDEGGALASPELISRVGIGSRVKMVFVDVAEGLAIPQWMLDPDAQQFKPWRYEDQ